MANQPQSLCLRIGKSRYFEVRIDDNHYILRETATRGVWHNYHKSSYICFDISLHETNTMRQVSGRGLLLEVFVKYAPSTASTDGSNASTTLSAIGSGEQSQRIGGDEGSDKKNATSHGMGGAASSSSSASVATTADTDEGSEPCRQDALDIRPESDVIFDLADASQSGATGGGGDPLATSNAGGSSSSSSSSSSSKSSSSSGKVASNPGRKQNDKWTGTGAGTGAESSSATGTAAAPLTRRRFYINNSGKGTIKFRLNQLSSVHGGRMFQLVVRACMCICTCCRSGCGCVWLIYVLCAVCCILWTMYWLFWCVFAF